MDQWILKREFVDDLHNLIVTLTLFESESPTLRMILEGERANILRCLSDFEISLSQQRLHKRDIRF